MNMFKNYVIKHIKGIGIDAQNKTGSPIYFITKTILLSLPYRSRAQRGQQQPS